MSTVCHVKITKGIVLPNITKVWDDNNPNINHLITYMIDTSLDFTIVESGGKVKCSNSVNYEFTPSVNGIITIEIEHYGYTQYISFSQDFDRLITEKLVHANLYMRSGSDGNYIFTFHSGVVFDLLTGEFVKMDLEQSDMIMVLKNKEAITYNYQKNDYLLLEFCDKKQVCDGYSLTNDYGHLFTQKFSELESIG